MRQLSTASTAAQAREGIGALACPTYRGQCSQSTTSAKSKLASEHVLEEPLLDFASAAFADLGHMKVDERRGQTGVSEIGAHLSDGHPILEQVGCETMPQGVAGRVLL